MGATVPPIRATVYNQLYVCFISNLLEIRNTKRQFYHVHIQNTVACISIDNVFTGSERYTPTRLPALWVAVYFMSLIGSSATHSSDFLCIKPRCDLCISIVKQTLILKPSLLEKVVLKLRRLEYDFHFHIDYKHPTYGIQSFGHF